MSGATEPSNPDPTCHIRESVTAIQGIITNPARAEAEAVRELSAFKALDNLIVAFRLSIPKEYRDPFAQAHEGLYANPAFRGGHGMSVDPVLYTMHVLTSV